MPETRTDRDLILHQISHDLHRLVDLMEAILLEVRPRLEIAKAWERGGLLAARAAKKRANNGGAND